MKLFAAFSLLLLFPLALNAQVTTPAPDALPCSSERIQFCPDKSAPEDSILCLYRHAEQLSPLCKGDLQRFIEAKRQAAGRAGGALTGFGGPTTFGVPEPVLGYQGTLTPSEQGGPTQMSNRFEFATPVMKAGGHTLALSATAEQIDYGQTLQLDSGRTVASDLDRFEVGLQYQWRRPDLRSWNFKVAAGYAGDGVAQFPHDASYSFTGSYGFPASATEYWVVLVYVANNSVLANYIPIPGFIYIKKTKHFTGMFGFPVFSLQWTPEWTPGSDWVVSAAIFGVTLQSEIAYGAVGTAQTFLGYTYGLESFIPSVRVDDRDRILVHNQKAALGYRVPIANRVLIEAQAGYAFDRFVTIETGLLRHDGGTLELPAGAFASLGLKYAF